ncbi:MAG TPA: hypothetical protein VK147_08505 [Candidatus Didemnitutus sp.]|nr:hypothetical protein [Candidatus Didemnitutus sp.]
MATTGYEPEDFLKEHIPYRLELLDTYCTAILLGIYSGQSSSRIASEFILPTEYGFKLTPTTQIFNIALETGLITFRLLMEFLGLTVDDSGEIKAIEAKRGKRRKDDFPISKIQDVNGESLAAVNPDTIADLKVFEGTFLGSGVTVDVKSKFAEMYIQANKAAAHLVQNGRPYHRLDNYLACLVLRSLVEVVVYDRLNERKLLKNLGVWSNTLLHPSVLVEHERAVSEVYKFVQRKIATQH